MTLDSVVLALSIALQILACVFAIRLVRLTGWYSPWLLVALAIALMAIRRAMPLVDSINSSTSSSFAFDLFGMVVSLLFAIGLWLVAPRFESVRERANQELHAAQMHAKESEAIHSTATTISHELACPITGILADAKMLLEHPALSGDERVMLEEIHLAAQKMRETLRKLENVDQIKLRRYGREYRVIEI